MASKRRSVSHQGLDQSLIIEGKRTRKPVKRFEFETTTTEAMTDGDSITLGSFERVKQNIMFIAVDKLKPLHKILFGTVGKAATLKQDIENFKGFSYPVGSPTYKRLKSALEKLSDNDLLTMKTALDLGGSDDKDNMVAAILEFLMTLKKPVTPKKRLSDENEVGSSEAKKPRQSNSPKLGASGLQLSESSSDEDELEKEVRSMKAVKPKKRVSFEDEQRLVQFGKTDNGGDVPRLVETPDDIGSRDGEDLNNLDVGQLSEFGSQVVEQLIKEATNTSKITVGWVIEETIKQNPEFIHIKQVIREHAIRIICSMDPSRELCGTGAESD